MAISATEHSELRCDVSLISAPSLTGLGPTLTTDLTPPSTGQDADTASRDLPPVYEELEHLDLPTYSTLELGNEYQIDTKVT